MLFDHAIRKLKYMALPLSCLMALALATAPALLPQAQATDLGASAEEGHFVRIGLGKSVVIKLPASAKDMVVGDPNIVDAVMRNKNTAYLFARTPGQTNIFFFDAQGRQIMNVDLEVALDMKALQQLIKRTNPKSRVTVDTVGKNVVLGGVAANAAEARLVEDMAGKFAGGATAVVNTMKIASGDQVMLKVRVVEIKRDVLKELGVDLETAFSIGNLTTGFATGLPIDLLDLPVPSAVASYQGSDYYVDGVIRALETEGLVHTLAEPTLSAISGASASFHAGGELPYRDCNEDDGVRTCDITFRPIGVNLSFTPIVLSEGRISLKIGTEVSERGEIEEFDDLTRFPTIETRRADTTVELPSGGSMVMAGLIKNVTQQDIEGTPGLKDLPILGALFRSRDFQQETTELAVIVTPYVVNPVHESQLATPADRLNIASDGRTILFGRLNKIYGTADHYPDGVYHGNVGFIIE